MLLRYSVAEKWFAPSAHFTPSSTLRLVSGRSVSSPYRLKRWYSVGALKAVPAEAVTRQFCAKAKP